MVGGKGPRRATPAPRVGPCIVCGQPIDGSEPWWLVAPPDRAEHERCRDWARHPFPYRAELRRQRRAARDVAALWVVIVRAGTVLALAEEGWPQNARASVARARRELARVRLRFEDLLGRGNPLRR